MFYRLLVVVDDYGCTDARPVLVLARCYPLRIGKIQPDQMASWLQELTKVGLITLYQIDGKDYLQIAKWEQHQHIRTKRHKYPLPVANGNNPQQIAATLDKLVQSATICNNSQQSVTTRNNLLPESNPYPNPNPIQSESLSNDFSLPKHRSMRQR